MAGKFESKTKQSSKKGLIGIICVLVVAIGFTVLMVSLRENAKAKEMSEETITATQPIQTFSTASTIQNSLPILETTIPIIETTEATTETIAADNNSVTYAAFYAATNMTRNELTTKVGKSGTSYFYKDIELLSEDVEWITNPINKEGTVNQGAIYRKMAKLLAGFNMFLNDGSNYCELLTGMPYSNRDDFADYASNADDFICMEEELYHILKKFESLETASGTFDFPNNTFHFVIDDLTVCAAEMQISEEMLGYVLAMMDEYAFSFTFESNSCAIDYDALFDFGWN